MKIVSSLGVRVAAAVAASALLSVPLIMYAAEFRTGEQTSVSAGERISGNLYIAGGNVNVAGAESADLIAGGGTVIVSGSVAKDAIIGGGNVTIIGNVGDDVRAAGGSLNVEGTVGNDLVLAGGQINVNSAKVGGDVMIGGGTVHITAPIAGSARIAGGTIVIDGPVAGSVFVRASKLTLTKNAIISGDLTYTAEKEATMETGASVRGKTTFTPAPAVPAPTKAGVAALLSLALFGKFLMQLVCALALALFFKRYTREIVTDAATSTLASLGRGFVAFVVLPAASIVLLMTILGIPLGIFGLIGYAAFLILSWLLAPIILGSLLHKWMLKPAEYVIDWKTVVLGSVAYFILLFIPFIGWLIRFGLILIAMGASTRLKWHVAKEWR